MRDLGAQEANWALEDWIPNRTWRGRWRAFPPLPHLLPSGDDVGEKARSRPQGPNRRIVSKPETSRQGRRRLRPSSCALCRLKGTQCSPRRHWRLQPRRSRVTSLPEQSRWGPIFHGEPPGRPAICFAEQKGRPFVASETARTSRPHRGPRARTRLHLSGQGFSAACPALPPPALSHKISRGRDGRICRRTGAKCARHSGAERDSAPERPVASLEGSLRPIGVTDHRSRFPQPRLGPCCSVSKTPRLR